MSLADYFTALADLNARAGVALTTHVNAGWISVQQGATVEVVRAEEPGVIERLLPRPGRPALVERRTA